MRRLGKREGIAVGVAVAAVIILLFGNTIWSYFTGSNQSGIAPTTGPGNALLPSSNPAIMTNISNIQGLQIYDETVGTGAEALPGKTITVHYVGVLEDGTKFDSSVDRGQPFQFNLGTGMVIEGWDRGFEGMKVGGIRRLVISPELGYGASGAGDIIPPNATLIFQVQLLNVE